MAEASLYCSSKFAIRGITQAAGRFPLSTCTLHALTFNESVSP